MEMLYTSRGIHNFLDVDMGERRELEDRGLMYKIRMLEKNSIPYLATPFENEVDGKFFLRFNTESNYVLERLVRKIRPDGRFLKLIFGQLVSCINGSSLYLLNPNDIVINPEYMFFNNSEERLMLVCVPGYEQNITLQLKALLEYFMRILDHRDQEGVRYLYELYDRVTDDDFSLSEYGRVNSDSLQRLSCDEKRNAAPVKEFCDIKATPDVNAPGAKKFEEPVFSEDDDDALKIDGSCILVVVLFSLALVMGARYIFGGRKLLFLALCISSLTASAVFLIFALRSTREELEIDESMRAYESRTEKKQEERHEEKREENCEEKHEARREEKHGEYKLVPLNNGCLEPLEIKADSEEINIGRGKKENAYRLSGSQISRVHARVYKRNEGLYVRDAGSTNGTFVNSERLSENAEVRLKRGDVVAFATEEFFVS